MDATKTLVLLFNTRANPALAARVHSEECPMVNTASTRRFVKRVVVASKGTLEQIQGEIDDLNEREFPVKFCKCCKGAK